MCSSKPPKIAKPAPPPAPPPPPTETAKKVENPALKKRNTSKRTGVSALTVRRSSVNTGSTGSGAKINY